MKDKINKILIIVAIIVLSIIFCTYSPVVTFDSSHYLWLANMLTPQDTIQNWDIARGAVFPAIIVISNLLLGHNAKGLIIMMFLFYVLMIWTMYLILKNVNSEEKIFEGKIKKWILAIILLLLVVLNPIILGYYHVVLTEFIAITFGLVGCLVAWKWMEIEFYIDKKKYIIYTLFLAFMTAISWHLKQPYVSTILFPILIATIISIIQNFKLKNILFRVGTVLICLISLFVSIFIWNKILDVCNVEIEEDRTSQSFLSGGIFSGLSQLYELEKQDIDKYKLSEKNIKEITKIENGESTYKNYKIYRNVNENKKDLVLYIKGDNCSTGESMKFLLKTFFTSPGTVIKSYTTGYLGIIDVLEIGLEVNKIDKTERMVPKTNIIWLETYENEEIAYRIYNNGLSNIFQLDPRYEKYAAPYGDINQSIKISNYLIKKMRTPTVVITKVCFLIMPIALIAEIIISIVKRKKYTMGNKKISNLIIILLAFSFLHIMLHTVLGAIIDRYTVPVMIPMFLAYIIIIFRIIKKEKKAI